MRRTKNKLDTVSKQNKKTKMTPLHRADSNSTPAPIPRAKKKKKKTTRAFARMLTKQTVLARRAPANL
jgi:hypothetical protein